MGASKPALEARTLIHLQTLFPPPQSCLIHGQRKIRNPMNIVSKLRVLQITNFFQQNSLKKNTQCHCLSDHLSKWSIIAESNKSIHIVSTWDAFILNRGSSF